MKPIYNYISTFLALTFLLIGIFTNGTAALSAFILFGIFTTIRILLYIYSPIVYINKEAGEILKDEVTIDEHEKHLI